jgi:hypothetical protein
MLPVRVLVVCSSRSLLRRVGVALELEGYMVTPAGGKTTPAAILARTVPDLVVAQVRPDRTSIEVWRRAIDSYRTRRPLSVLALVTGSIREEERKVLEEVADLGIAERPLRKRAIMSRLEDWYTSEAPMLRVG